MALSSKLFLAAALVIPAAAQAGSDRVEHGPPPSWVVESEPLDVPADVSGLVFVRRLDTLTHLDAKGQSTFFGQSLKILDPQALQLGNLTLMWNPASGTPIVHRVLIRRDGKVIDVLKDTEFEILRREDMLEQSMLTGMLTAVMRVPDLRVGDELEFAATTPTSDPTLADRSAGFMFIAAAPPPGRLRLGLSWEAGQEPNTRLTEDIAQFAQRGPYSLEMRLDNAPILSPPKDSPPRFAWQRVIEFSDFADWKAVSSHSYSLYDAPSRIGATSQLRAEAAQIAATQKTQMDRARAALRLVQDQIRYIYVGLEGGNIRPATADETWSRRYGDCKGKTALLLALFRELGIEGEAVLASNSNLDDGLDARLPNPGIFDHVLVRARIAGTTYWFDGTLPGVYGPTTVPVLPYRVVLPLKADGSALENLPQEPSRLPSEMGLVTIDARTGFDLPARLVSKTVSRGLKGLQVHVATAPLSKAELTAQFRNRLANDPFWEEIEDVTYSFDPLTQAAILTISGTGRPEWDDEDDGGKSLTLPGGGFNPPSRRQRPREQDQTAPYYSAPDDSCYVTTVLLPRETKVANWGFNSVFDTRIFGRAYYRMMEKRPDGSINMVRGSRVIDTEISPDQAQRDNERIARFDNSKAVISYEPGQVIRGWGALEPVAAADDKVWLGSDPPCFSPSA